MRMRNLAILPPQNDKPAEWLRYMVQSIEPEAGELPFLVSLWSSCLYNGGAITPQQAQVLQPYLTEAEIFLNTYVRNPIENDMTNVVPMDADARAALKQAQQNDESNGG